MKSNELHYEKKDMKQMTAALQIDKYQRGNGFEPVTVANGVPVVLPWFNINNDPIKEFVH